MSLICLHNATVYTGITSLPKSTVLIENGKIEDVISNERFRKRSIPKDATIYYLNGAIISPGFVDTHIHGVHGYDTSDGSVESILEMSRALIEYGVTGFCPTIYPQSDEDFIKSIRAVVEAIGQDNLLIMHATSAYPCPPDELNLKMIQTLRSKFDAPIGYSGHEVGLVPSAVAVAMGACAVERHITLDRALWGSDQAASVEPGGLQKLVKYIRVTEQALGDGVKHVYESEMPSLRKLRRV